MTNVNYVFFIILECSYLFQIHIFWKLVHVFFVHNIFVAIGSAEWAREVLFWNYKRLSIYTAQKQSPGASVQKVFKTSQNSQENIYAKASLLIKLQTCGLQLLSLVATSKLFILFQRIAVQMLLRKNTRTIISSRDMLIAETEFEILIMFDNNFGIWWWLAASG